jgi:hypothetical protein
MDAVRDYIEQFDDEQKETMLYLHEFLSCFPGIHSKITYNIPFYYRKSWICYLNPVKNQGVELAFTRGNELSNQQGVLISAGRKQVRGLIFNKESDINLSLVNEIFQEAVLLDEEIPYASKRKKRTG